MPRDSSTADRFLILDENLKVVTVTPRPSQRGKPARRLKQLRSFPAPPAIAPDRPVPPSYSLVRIRRLLLAALRVWELKHGIHDYYGSAD
jgi:hypothetical protein